MGVEPTTLTLARLRSTNWATSALIWRPHRRTIPADFSRDRRVNTPSIPWGHNSLNQFARLFFVSNHAIRRAWFPLNLHHLTVIMLLNQKPYDILDDPSYSTRIHLVDRRGIEPRPMPCKGIVLPLSLSARKLSNLKLLYQKMLLMSSLLSKTNLVPLDRIELPNPDYKTGVIPFN